MTAAQLILGSVCPCGACALGDVETAIGASLEGECEIILRVRGGDRARVHVRGILFATCDVGATFDLRERKGRRTYTGAVAGGRATWVVSVEDGYS